MTPIKLGLGLPCHPNPGEWPKRQTIRWPRKRSSAIKRKRQARDTVDGHAMPGETLQLYFGMRTKHCEKIGDAKCIKVRRITIWIEERDIIVHKDGKLLGPRQLQQFARDDGFAGPKDMHAFWLKDRGVGKHEPYLIEWEPIA